MVEVFITDVYEEAQAKPILETLQYFFPQLEINFDLSDSDRSDSHESFPCGHSILRVEGPEIDAEKIISAVNQSGFRCSVLEDKPCY